MTDEEIPAVSPEPEAVQERRPTPSGTRRVPANPDLPKLRKKTEEKIAAGDEKSAQGYDALEEATEKITALRQRIEDGQVMVELEVTDTGVHFLKKI